VAAVTATDEIPLWLAQQDGFFRKQGLDVTVTPVTTGPLAIPDMLAGRIDVLAGGNYVSIFKGQATGTFNMRVIAPAGSCSEDDFAILALPNSGITKPSDLSGQTISVPTTASISTLLITAQLSKNGVNPASVHYVDIPFLSASAALQQHRVPAITMVEPFLSEAKAAGAQEVMRLCADTTANMPLSGDFATASWTQKHPGAAAAFQRAITEGATVASSDPEAARKALLAHVKLPPSIAGQVQLNIYPTSLDAAQIRRVTDLMEAGGLLKSSLDVTPLLLQSTKPNG